MPKYSVQCSFNSLVPENEFDLEESDPTFEELEDDDDRQASNPKTKRLCICQLWIFE